MSLPGNVPYGLRLLRVMSLPGYVPFWVVSSYGLCLRVVKVEALDVEFDEGFDFFLVPEFVGEYCSEGFVDF